ncbi:MAG TPA: phosphatase PAP2 family protein [Thermoanaerobaculia bacterium]|nr:phosphatase PAP2 family protein [Thermoanaerobaculia bacterium]
MKDEPFLAWPGWAHLREAAALSLANALWFAFVYGGADLLTARRAFRVPVHLPAELRIPFVPWMTVFYMSLYILFVLAPFVLRTRREFRAVIGVMAVAILASGIAFLLFPAELAFGPVREEDLGIWAGLYRIADGLNLTYNLLPSLHVTLAVLCVSAFSPRAPRTIRALLWLWAFLIAASTVLIHQHHVLDAVAGWLLAILLSRSWGRATSAARC